MVTTPSPRAHRARAGTGCMPHLPLLRRATACAGADLPLAGRPRRRLPPGTMPSAGIAGITAAMGHTAHRTTHTAQRTARTGADRHGRFRRLTASATTSTRSSPRCRPPPGCRSRSRPARPSTAMRMVDRLVAAGSVTRQANPGNRREVVLGLTARGRELVERVPAHRPTGMPRSPRLWPAARRPPPAARRSAPSAPGSSAHCAHSPTPPRANHPSPRPRPRPRHRRPHRTGLGAPADGHAQPGRSVSSGSFRGRVHLPGPRTPP
ncbi:MarR family transcriptional regulator [Streptomyces sp. NPDC002446]